MIMTAKEHDEVEIIEHGVGGFEFTGEELGEDAENAELAEALDGYTTEELETLYWKKKVMLVKKIEDSVDDTKEREKGVAEDRKKAFRELVAQSSGRIGKTISKLEKEYREKKGLD